MVLSCMTSQCREYGQYCPPVIQRQKMRKPKYVSLGSVPTAAENLVCKWNTDATQRHTQRVDSAPKAHERRETIRWFLVFTENKWTQTKVHELGENTESIFHK